MSDDLLALSDRQAAQFARMAGALSPCHRKEFQYLVSLLLRNCGVVSDDAVNTACDTAYKHVLETSK